MSALTATQTVRLTDAEARDLGRVQIESLEGGLLRGDFEPGSDYPSVEPIFRFFSDVVEQQSFSFLDEAESAVARLGVRLRVNDSRDPIPVHDVQIYPDGGFSCRFPPASERNSHH